ncbi:MAG: hypothetical protein ACM3SU_12130 [Acidobacteriota bacterium]
MNDDLRALIEADEEARARIDAARAAAKSRLEEAAADVEKARTERRGAEQERLASEARAILDEAEREAARRRERRSAALAERRASAEPLVSTAADYWARVIREGPSPARRP